MVRFPEQDPRQLPEFPTTSLQQRWRVKQTEALTARRTWKSTQMGLVALCAQFRTFLTREFGEDYLSGMAKEFEAVDLGATNSAPFVNAVRVLQGPSRDIQPPSAPSEGATEAEIEAYTTNLASYELAVENLKSYAGMAVPDAETANRIVTLVVKLRQYRQSAEEAGLESMQYAMESICLGEIPSAALLRDLPQMHSLGTDKQSLNPLILLLLEHQATILLLGTGRWLSIGSWSLRGLRASRGT